MTVRAKLILQSITEHAFTGTKVLNFSAQYDATIPEDQRFQKATPNASAQFSLDNPDAVAKFTLGEAYYVDFTPAPAVAPAPKPSPHTAPTPQATPAPVPAPTPAKT